MYEHFYEPLYIYIYTYIYIYIYIYVYMYSCYVQTYTVVSRDREKREFFSSLLEGLTDANKGRRRNLRIESPLPKRSLSPR